MSNRVLLTGAGGFIGRHCLEPLLAGGWEVHAVGRGAPPPGAGDVRWHRLDLHDGESRDRVVAEIGASRLLHLAWHTAAGATYAAPENLRWVETSVRLLEAFRDGGGRRAVVAGSCAEYDWSQGYLAETTPCRPASLYGSAKHALHVLFEALTRDSEIRGAWARIFFAYGPGEHPARLVPSVVRALLAGEEARCTHGNQVRDYLYVGDVADALVRLLASDLEGPINVASGQPLALRELIGRTARRLDGEERVRLGALPAREDEPPMILADVKRLTQELDWKPATGLDAGIERTVAWWRRELASSGEPGQGGTE